MTSEGNKQPLPGEGIRSLRASTFFKVTNFELYAKPNLIVMGIGLLAFTGCTCYIAYMRNKYEKLGYYSAVKEDGTEAFVKRTSKWD
ncbi:hypothetical protein RN001_007794 [Aquatica leii]|uniref:Small integral membrane protein 8 n=1 Tax=Aquatica leii TaxID=1421715 RepID=A0AAN7QIK6_9COLE|nr:hypothetical protein RN001_007794 [Aquatica leii]